jgi:uncharacterized membrane protein YeaQ/YmgE (transglycosylase-associated protein family)
MSYSIEYWVGFLVIGLMVGWVAGMIMKGRGFGLAGNVVVGVLGAVVGGWLFNVLGVTTYGTGGAFVTALVGAMVLVGLTGFFKLAS